MQIKATMTRSAGNSVICVLSLRCRLLQYAVCMATKQNSKNPVFSANFILWHLVFQFFPLKMCNKTIIGLGFGDMPNYQCLGKSYHEASRSAWPIAPTSTLIILHITKTSSSNCLLCCQSLTYLRLPNKSAFLQY